MQIKKHIQYLKLLSKYIGGRLRLSMIVLVLGGTLMGFLELIGVMAIFPLMTFIHSPAMVESNGYLNKLQSILNIDQNMVITLFGIIIIGIFAFKNIFQIVYLKYEFSVLANWRISLAEKFFKSSIYSDYDILIARSSSDNISTITNVVSEVISNYFFQFIQLLNLIISASILLSFLIIAYTQVSLIVLSLGACLIYAHNLFLKKQLKTVGERSRKLSAENISILQQSFKGLKETKIHLKEHYFFSKFCLVNRSLAGEQRKLMFYQNLPSASIEFMMMSLIIIVFIYFTVMESAPGIIFAKLGTLTIVSIRLVPLINRAIHALLMINHALEPLEKLFTEAKRLNLLKNSGQDKDYQGTPLPFKHRLTFKDVSYRYQKGHLFAINQVNLTILKGQFVGFVGPSGGGKTTIIDLLAGFLHPIDGQYLVDGKWVDRHNVRSLRKLIGYVSQHVFLLNDTLENNVAYGEQPEDINTEKVIDVLKKAKLWDYVSTLKKGLKTHIGEDGNTLSGGQRQRLSIARALYHKAQILILDEASATLDVETEFEFFEYLNSLKNELTVIIVAHRLATLKGCDILYFIENGRVADSGTHETLKATNERFARYVKYSTVEEQENVLA